MSYPNIRANLLHTERPLYTELRSLSRFYQKYHLAWQKS